MGHSLELGTILLHSVKFYDTGTILLQGVNSFMIQVPFVTWCKQFYDTGTVLLHGVNSFMIQVLFCYMV